MRDKCDLAQGSFPWSTPEKRLEVQAKVCSACVLWLTLLVRSLEAFVITDQSIRNPPTIIPHMSNTPHLSRMDIPGVRSCPMDRWRKKLGLTNGRTDSIGGRWSPINRRANWLYLSQVVSDGPMDETYWFHLSQLVSHGPMDELL